MSRAPTRPSPRIAQSLPVLLLATLLGGALWWSIGAAPAAPLSGPTERSAPLDGPPPPTAVPPHPGRIPGPRSSSGAEDASALEAWTTDHRPEVVPHLAAALNGGRLGATAQRSTARALERWAPIDARARAALISHLADPDADADSRATAYRAVLSCGTEIEVEAGLRHLASETGADVVLAAAQGLAAHRSPAVRQHARTLHWNHPDPEVRRRLRQLGLGR